MPKPSGLGDTAFLDKWGGWGDNGHACNPAIWRLRASLDYTAKSFLFINK